MCFIEDFSTKNLYFVFRMSHNRGRNKRPRHHDQYYNRNYSYQNDPQNTPSQSQASITQDEIDNDLPGFYYDPMKKRHFRIQSNNFGISSVITSESMKNKSSQENLEKRTQTQLKKCEQRMLQIELDRELYGALNRNLILDYKDKIIQTYELNNLFEMNENCIKIKRFDLIKHNESSFMLVNFVSNPYFYRILQINPFLFNEDNKSKSNLMPKYTQIDLLTVNNDSFFNNNQNSSIQSENSSFIPAHIQNENLLISTYQVFNANYRKTIQYKLNISRLNFDHVNTMNRVLIEDIHTKSYSQPMWCTTINSKSDMYLVGLPNCAQVNDSQDKLNTLLNTNSSDAYCLKFKPDVIQKSCLVN